MNCLLGETKPNITSNTNDLTTNTNSSTNNSSTSNTSATTATTTNTTTTTTTPASTSATIASSHANNSKINSNNLNSNIINNTSSSTSSSTINSQEACLICGDVASGKHYGLRSCEACKAFFKRTVQGKIEYSCPATRECEINKRRRKACQACRFQKCLNMGMLKEGVRLDRVRGGRQKYRRGLSPGPNGNIVNSNNSNNNNTNSNNNNNNSVSCGNDSNTSGNNGSGNANGAHHQNQNLLSGAAASSSSIPLNAATSANARLANQFGLSLGGGGDMLFSGNTETNRIMTALINCEPEELTASQAQYVTNVPSTLSFQMKTLYILSDLFDRELVSLIGWAKQIPGFSETITLNDQMRLLQSTWAEVIALSIGYRSHLKRIESYNKHQSGNGSTSTPSGHLLAATPSPTSSSPASNASTTAYNTNSNTNSNHSLYNNSLESTEIRLVFAKDLIVDFKHAVACGAEEIFYNCVQLIKRLDQLRMTPKEYMLLKAISLTNADVRLENPRATHQLRDLVMETLYEATISDYISASNTSSSSSLNNIKLGHTLASGNNKLIDAQDRALSLINSHYGSPPRPSSSVPSSSSLSVSPHATTSSIVGNNNGNNHHHHHNHNQLQQQAINLDSLDLINRKSLVNSRLNQVLLCLPVLRQIDSCIRKFWNDIRKGPNSVPMNKLFEEMLEPCQRVYRSSAEM